MKLLINNRIPRERMHLMSIYYAVMVAEGNEAWYSSMPAELYSSLGIIDSSVRDNAVHQGEFQGFFRLPIRN